MYVCLVNQSFNQLMDAAQYDSAKGAYRRVLDRDANHAKVLQQLGWLHHQESPLFASQEQAIEYLEKSVSSGKRRLRAGLVEAVAHVRQITLMPKAGTCWEDVTCHNKSIPKPTKPISKPYIAMVAIPRSGARSVCFTIRSINIGTHWMHTPEQYA